MKKYLVSIILIITIIISSCISYASDNEVDRSLEYLNDIRKNVSVGKLKINKKLSQASLIHTKYMYYNNSFSTTEESDKLFYRGRYATNRAAYYRYHNHYIFELLNKDSKTYNKVITNFLNNPYSRTVLLDPVYEDIGMGTFKGFYSLNVGGEKRTSDKEVFYPYDNQLNVPITWENKYYLNPYNQISNNNDSYGLPITFTYYSDRLRVNKFRISYISLTNKVSNNEIKYKIITPETDKYLKNTIVVLPLEKYDYNTTYEFKLNATLEFTDGTQATIDSTKYFTTEIDKTSVSHNNKLLTRAKCVEEIVKVLDLRLLQPYSIKFNDVDIKSASAKYIYTAEENSIALGMKGEEGSNKIFFRPDDNVTKEQLYAMLIRGYEHKEGIHLNYYDDSSDITDYYRVSKWCKDGNYILKAKQFGILYLDDDLKLFPKEHITEYEFQIILKKFYEEISK